jgi:hypothetical protein
MPARLLFLLLCCTSATLLSAQIEWNPQVGRTFGGAEHQFTPAGDATAFEASSRGGWVVGLDVRTGGGDFFLVPGIRWQHLDYVVQYDRQPTNGPLFRDGDVQLLTLPLGIAYRLRPAHTSINLNLHAGVFYQFELAQATVGPAGDPPLDWHPDRGYGARLGVGLDIDWLTFHLNTFPRFGRPDLFAEPGAQWPFDLTAGVRF